MRKFVAALDAFKKALFDNTYCPLFDERDGVIDILEDDR